MTPKCPDCKRDQDDCICASPASAPKGFALVPVVPTHAILDVMFNAGIDRHDGDLTILYRAILAAAPTPPVLEGVDPVMTKEELIAAAESIGMRFPGASIPPASEDRKDAERYRFIDNSPGWSMCRYVKGIGWTPVHPDDIDQARQEDKP